MRSPPCKKPTRGRRRLPRSPWPARPPSRRHGEQTGHMGRKAVRGAQPAFRASSPLSVIQGGPALRKHPPQIQTRSGIFFPQRGLFLRVPDTGPPGADAAGGRASGALFPPGHGEPREGPSGPARHPSAARGGHIVSVRRDLRTCSAPLPAVQAPVMSVPVLRWVPPEGGTPRSPGLGRRLGLWLGPWQPSEDLPLPLGGAASMGGRPRPRALRGLLPRARAAPGHGLAGAGRPPAFPVWSARRGGWWTPRGCAGRRVPGRRAGPRGLSSAIQLCALGFPGGACALAPKSADVRFPRALHPFPVFRPPRAQSKGRRIGRRLVSVLFVYLLFNKHQQQQKFPASINKNVVALTKPQ